MEKDRETYEKVIANQHEQIQHLKNKFYCDICKTPFSSKHKPWVIKCGHTVCDAFLDRLQ